MRVSRDKVNKVAHVGTDALADLLTSLGIEIEAGVWTVEDARLLGASSFGGRVIRVLLEPVDRSPDGAVATAAEASAELIRLGAYRAGTNPEVDSAVKLHPLLDAFLAQRKDEQATLGEGYAALNDILDGAEGRAG